MLRWFDFAILAYLAVPLPWLAAIGYRRLLRRLAAGDEAVRLRTYRLTMAIEWLSVAVLLTLWVGVGRQLDALGLRLPGPDWRFWLGNGLALAAGLLLLAQSARVARTPESLADVRRKIGHLEEMVPHTHRELKTFRALSVTAGVCEEIIYRGYLIWALTALGGIWWALAGSAIFFSLGHLYQGPKSLIGLLLVGLVMAALFLLTQAIWAPMALHAVIDLSSGRSAYEAVRVRDTVST